MFCGYETRKASVEKYTKSRINQPEDLACEGCMKMCPGYREDTEQAAALRRLSVEKPQERKRIIAADDAGGRGILNLVRCWWFELEMPSNVAVELSAGSNGRDVNIDRDEKLAKIKKFIMFSPEL